MLCISPLTAIMMEQVSKFRSSGLTTEFVGSAQTSSSACKRVVRGEVQLVFITPESLEVYLP